MLANRLKLNSEKTELVWVGSRYEHTPLGSGGPSLQLGTYTVDASDHVRVLGVTISSDLSLDKHVSTGPPRGGVAGASAPGPGGPKGARRAPSKKI